MDKADRFSLHPPTTSLLLVPIAWLDPSARVVWQVFNLVLFGWLLIDAAQTSSSVWRILFVAFALVYTPSAEIFVWGKRMSCFCFCFPSRCGVRWA